MPDHTPSDTGSYAEVTGYKNAEADKKVIGVVWVRIMNDYGHVEEGVPSFAISYIMNTVGME